MIKFLPYMVFLFAVYVPAFSQDRSSVKHFGNGFKTYSELKFGEFTNWDEAEQETKTGASFWGSKLLNKSFLTGSFKYENTRKSGTIWPFLHANYNPYLIVDFTNKNFIGNAINMNGIYAYEHDSMLTSAVSVNYTTGSDYNRSDPRYKIDYYDFNFSPSLRLSLKNGYFALSPELQMGKTELNMVTELHDRSVVVYQLLGLGVTQNPEIVEIYNMLSRYENIGATFVHAFNKGSLGYGIELSLLNTKVRIDKSNINWSVFIPEAVLNGIKTNLSAHISYKNKNTSHSILYAFNSVSNTGEEFIRHQTVVPNSAVIIWKTFGANDNYKFWSTLNRVNYSLLNDNGNRVLTFLTGISSMFETESYFTNNDTYNTRFSMYEPMVQLGYEKQYANNSLRFDAGLQKNILQSYDYRLLNGEISEVTLLRKLSYLKSNANIMSFSAIFGREIRLKERNCFAKFELSGKIISPDTGKKTRTLISASLQFDF